MNTIGMPARIAVISLGLDQKSYGVLSQVLANIPGAVLLGNLDNYSGAEREIGHTLDLTPTRICFIDYDRTPNQAVWVTERLRAEFPGVHTFGVSTDSQPEKIIAAMRAGCAEYLLKPLQEERVVDGLTRVEAKQKAHSRGRGKVITFLGAKGGTGVTTLALHLALQLARDVKHKCLIVDQHPVLGDVSLYLGIGRHQYSFYELASNRDRLDEDLLKGFLLHHTSGIDVLDAPETVDAIHGAPPSAVQQTLAFLADVYQFVVVDCPPGITEGTLASVATSDQVAIVMTAELPSVRNTVRYIEHLSTLGYNSSLIQVVLNRSSKKGALSDERIEKALGRNISVRVPNNYNEVIKAINTGEPISTDSRSDFSAAIQAWAKELIGHSNVNGKAMSAALPRTGLRALFGN